VINDEPAYLSPSSPLSDAHFIYEKPQIDLKQTHEEFLPMDDKLS